MSIINGILESVWFMGIVLISAPLVLYSYRNNKKMYWFLAIYCYLYVILDFLEAVIVHIK